tara:strand:- start:222 stop:455 length:234 start_codon:yes stop_codon:yes gene_type:complete
MDKDIKAVKLSLQELGKEAVLGIFGANDADQMLGKMYAVIDLAAHLRIEGITISVDLKDLVEARIEYLKSMDEDESP